MNRSKLSRPQQLPDHGNGARLAGLVATFTVALSLLAAPLFG